MGKRSKFERKERDFYPTPLEAVLPLLAHLPPNSVFAEPCAGDGALVNHLEGFGHECRFASDIEPAGANITQCDAMHVYKPLFVGRDIDYIITNPPWDRKILHPMIDHFRHLAPTWLLFDSDWMFTKQASGLTGQPTNYLNYCHAIVSVGRVKWFGNQSGKDNCAWYLFKDTVRQTRYYAPT